MDDQTIAELDETNLGRLDEAVRQLEESWRKAAPANLAQLVPPLNDPLHARALFELIKIDQECRWQSGQPKGLEAYLKEWPELRSRPETLADLVSAECLTRATLGLLPTKAEVESRFPEIAGRIDLSAIAAMAEREFPASRRAFPPSAVDTSKANPDNTPSLGLLALPLHSGQRFGRYEIRGLLGQGGMGTVYRAFDTQLDREVALKIPRLDATAEQTVLDRFLREAKAAAKIRHPNVCPVYDTGQIDGTYFITIAMIEGQSLAQWVEGQRPAARDAATLVLKLARALAAVHAAGILHRDIKPSNVMIDRHGEPLLMDFGLARQAESEIAVAVDARPDSALTATSSYLTSAGALIGTLPYMSREQVDGQTANAGSDVYSLGVLFYQLLTGELPFPGTFAEILDGIRHVEPTSPSVSSPDIDRRIEAICLKAMAKNRADRYQSAQELAEALEQCMEAAPRSKGPMWRHYWRAGVGAAIPPRFRTRGWLAAAGSAAILFGGILAASLIVRVYDKEGNEVAKITVPEGGTAKLSEQGAGTKTADAKVSPIPNPPPSSLYEQGKKPNPPPDISHSNSESERKLPPSALTLVAGDNLGNVTVMDDTTGGEIVMRNLDSASIGNITLADVAKSGTPQVLVTHSAGVKNLPTYSLSLASLAQNWQTNAPTAISPLTVESTSLFSGDFTSGGTTEIVVPYTAANGAWSSLGVFSGVTGKQRYAITQPAASPGNYYSVYYDPTRGGGTWRMVTDEGHDHGFSHYMNCYNLANGRLAWTSSANVNTWMVGSVGASAIDGEPREWGSWYGQTVYVLDGNGKLLWNKSYGRGYNAVPLYAGKLTVGGSESLVVGSASLGSGNNQVKDVSLANGGVLWTYTDTGTNTGMTAWEDPLACVDTGGTGVKTVFVWFHKHNGPDMWGRLLALSGSNGSLLWSNSFPNPSGLTPTVRFADINGDGKLAVLLNVKNTIQAFDGTTGVLLKTYTFSSTVTTFDAVGAARRVSQAGKL